MKLFRKKNWVGWLAGFLAICFVAVFAIKFAPPAYAASMEFLNTFYAAIGRTFIAVTPPTDGLIVEGRVGIGEPYPTAKFVIGNDTRSDGTVSNYASGTTVAGVGTHFTETCQVGDYISVDGAAPVKISTITSDTLMTVTAVTALHSAKTYTVYARGDGTMANILSGTTIAGTGTRFTETLRAGDTIYLSGVTPVVLTTVTSDVLMTVPAIANLNSGVTYLYANRSVLRAQGNGVVEAGSLKIWSYSNAAMPDDDIVKLPDATDGMGLAKCGVHSAYFTTTAAGAVVILSGTTNVNSTDVDANLCIFDSGTDVTIRNRLGSAQVVKVVYWYK
jgi:hypothetical protein